MRKLIILFCVFSISCVNAQEKAPTYTKSGDLVKATYYYSDGSIKSQGFFKDKLLTGEWTEFDQKGNKIAIGHYKAGKKVGKWFQWNNNILREINYANNTIVSVNTWKEDTKLALNNEE